MNSLPVQITVYGKPIPQGSKRHVGNGRMVESSKYLADWRTDIIREARTVMEQRMPLEGPLTLRAFFTVPKPVSAPKLRRTWPTQRPDVDKLLRGVCDALTAAGVWRDDSQVVHVSASKTYPGESETALHIPGVRLTVVPMETE